MSLVDEIRAHVKKSPQVCAACNAIATLTKKEQTELVEVIRDSGLPRSAVARWLSSKTGQKVPEYTLGNHVRMGH